MYFKSVFKVSFTHNQFYIYNISNIQAGLKYNDIYKQIINNKFSYRCFINV